jgi:hypothetical protein
MTDSLPEKMRTVENQIEEITAFIDKLDSCENSLSGIIETIQNNAVIQNDQITPLITQLREISNFIDITRNGSARLKVLLHAGFK